MVETKKISAVILTHNNKETIKQSVCSLRGIADELIIIDDFSTDTTLSQIKHLYPSARFFKRRLDQDFAAQRNFGISKALYPWILMIDSDEELSQKLRESILKEVGKKVPSYSAYRCKIKNYSLGTGSTQQLIRPILFRKDLSFKGKLHEQITGVDFGNLRGHLDHHSWIDCENWLYDMNVYSTNQAKKWLKERNWNKLQVFLLGITLPTFIFLKMFFWEGRWTRGAFAGFLYCLACSAEHRFALLKYYEMKWVKKK